MVASNSSDQAPFLTYLTVFKSRLAVVNLVLPLTGFAYIPEPTLSRKLRQRFSETVEIDVGDPSKRHVLDYLVEKRLVSGKEREEGRYAGLSLIGTNGQWKAKYGEVVVTRIKVFVADMWMADSNLGSTVGVPTPENSDEVLELCYQLQLLSKAKNTWTAAGQLTYGLRNRTAADHSANPFVFWLEIVALLRQVLEKDWFLIAELLRDAAKLRRFTRDGIALALPDIAERALNAAQKGRVPAPAISAGKKLVALLQKTAKNRAKASTAPGVLEHRASPRLEWLTDFGVLAKPAARNAFEYCFTDDGELLLSLMETDYGYLTSDETAIAYLKRSSAFGMLRRTLGIMDARSALVAGYRLMSRSVGPAPIREVCFAAAVLAPQLSEGPTQFSEALLKWAAEVRGITVSGGRYRRTAELVHMTRELTYTE